MLVPEATTHEAVFKTVKQTKPQNLESVELFDVFRGKNVPRGQKSMAYAFTYPQRGEDVDRCGSERGARKTRGAIQTKPPGGHPRELTAMARAV